MAVHVPRKVLITGGCGFIGSNFVNFIHDAWPEASFVNLDKLILNSDALYVKESVRTSPRYRLVLADIRNRDVVSSLLRENQIDTVIHLAADCTSTRCYGETIVAFENNLVAFIEFLEAVREYGRVQRFVHISTDEVYGDSPHGDDVQGKVETDRLRPGNPYAATKAAAEAYVHAYRAEYQLPLIILRINNIYGPNQWDVKVVPRFIDVARKKEKFTVQGSGKQIRSWLFVEDAAGGIQAVTERGRIGETYNIGSDFEMNVADLAVAVQAEVDRQLGREERGVEYESIPDRPYNDQRYLIDSSKMQKELGWKPTTPFSEGLRRVVEATLVEAKPSQKMSVIMFGGRGFVGQELLKTLVERKVPFQLAETKVGFNTDEEVIAELNRLRGTHVVCCTGRTQGGGLLTIEYLEGGPDRVYENVRDNLYSATALAQICHQLGLHYTYVGTGYIFAYDKEHPIGAPGFLEDDVPSFFGSSYSVAKGFTDRQQSQFKVENISARITLPLTHDLSHPRNLLSKIIKYKQLFDIPVSLSILPDCFDALVSLMEKRYGGSLNLVNPGPVSLCDIVQLYKEEVDPSISFERVGADTEKGRELLATKGNCALETTTLDRLQPIPTTEDSLRSFFRELASGKV